MLVVSFLRLATLSIVAAVVRRERIRSSGFENLCIHGHFVPELIVLGAQKAGTSTLSAQLDGFHGVIKREVENGEPDFFAKEAHIFDTERFNKGIDFWVSGYPTCSTDTRTVAVDMTPNYLPESSFVPGNLHEFYGAEAHRVKFVIVLKEPLARMHSQFYHYREAASEKHSWVPPQYVTEFKGSFQAYIQQTMRFKQVMINESDYHIDPFSISLYPPQLTDYLDSFDARQFVIVPFRKVVGSCSFAQHIGKTLGLTGDDFDFLKHANGSSQLVSYMVKRELPQLKPSNSQNGSLELVDLNACEADLDQNVHPHPSLEADLDPSVLAEARDFVNKHAGAWKLAEILTKQPGKEVELFDFAGDRTSAEAVAAWLSESWS